MPAFRDSLTDAQIADIVRHTRERYAPDAQPWREVTQRVGALRQKLAH
jgi:nicotinate dehydrogenase subunit B